MYFAGLVTDSEGATVEHAMLAMNLCGELYLALRGREHVVRGSDVLFETGPQEMLTYADLMVFCEPAKLKLGKPVVGRLRFVGLPSRLQCLLLPRVSERCGRSIWGPCFGGWHNYF